MAFLSRPRQSSPIIAATLIVALLLGGLPFVSGVILVRSTDQPAFTLDICHSVPGLNHGWDCSAAPLMNSRCWFERPLLSGPVGHSSLQFPSRIGDAPDPPPPETHLRLPV